MKRSTRTVLISMFALVVVGVIVWFSLFKNHQAYAPYRLEVGYNVSDAEFKIEHPGKRFPTEKPLLILAICDPNQSSSNSKSVMTVLLKSTQEVLQTIEWAEIPQSCDEIMKLQNTNWKPGTYLIRWERDGQEVATQELVLE